MNEQNRQWKLTSYPTEMPTQDNWRLENSTISKPSHNQVLAKALYLSVDPYMRGRISAKQGYTQGVKIGDVMCGGAVAQVIESKHPQWKSGDLIETIQFGWQEYALLDGDKLTRVDTTIGPAHAWLSYLGMPGITAWIALNEIGNPQTDDTVLVSAAAGAVGQIVGQLAKIYGCTAIAVASTQEKLEWCRHLGYDAVINYRESENLITDIKNACPDGIDIFFDNTAGVIHDATMQNLAMNARVIIVGTISLAGKFEQPDIGERHLRQILVKRAKLQGFLVFDYLQRYDEARKSLAASVQSGQIKFKTDFMDGIENMPQAFLKLLHSQNMGKQLVRTSFAANLPE